MLNKKCFPVLNATLLFLASTLAGYSQIFVWNADNTTNFDLTISGTGLGLGVNPGAGWTGTITSPSGLWTFSDTFFLEGVAAASVFAGIPQGPLSIGSNYLAWGADGNVTYNPTGLYSTTRDFTDLANHPGVGYWQLVSISPFYHPSSGGSLNVNGLLNYSTAYIGDNTYLRSHFRGGGLGFTVDTTNPSAWEWTLRVSESVGLEVIVVPEPSGIALFALTIFFCLSKHMTHNSKKSGV